MAELSEKLEIIDRKTYETPLMIERGLIRRRQLPVTIEARQIKPVKHAIERAATLGAISLISITDGAIKYDLTLQRGGNHGDLLLTQECEQIRRADGKLIVNIITRGWSCGKFSSVVYAWYDRGSIKERIRPDAPRRMTPKTLLVGCYALRELIQAVQSTNKLPDNLALTNNDIKRSEVLEHSGIHIESVPTKKFSQLVKSVYG